VVFLIGYLLSPLTWWNDAVVNLPLAWAFASAASWIYEPLFTPALVAGYWGTNLLGLLLMGAGGAEAAGRRRAGIGRSLLIGSAAYTLLIVVALSLGWIRPIPAFWRTGP
jgi:hypothetical protein